MAALVIALPEEAEGIQGYPIYLSGCGKVNATIATMKAINDGHKFIINFGSRTKTHLAKNLQCDRRISHRI